MRADANPEFSSLLVISLDGETLASSYNDFGQIHRPHTGVYNPGFDLTIGSQFSGLIYGLKYKTSSTDSQRLPPVFTPASFRYQETFENSVLIFFSFTR